MFYEHDKWPKLLAYIRFFLIGDHCQMYVFGTVIQCTVKSALKGTSIQQISFIE